MNVWIMIVSKDFKLEFQKKLIVWFHKSKRPMDWRETEDPYCIWISEMMLQQTQVNTALKYYQKFIRRFPNIQKLANADLHEVLKAWEGLGYYSRARNLHKAAKVIEKEYEGNIPNNYKDLKLLPGIGDYTASAIQSIAFNEKMAVVDGNVIRILTRVFRITENVDSLQVRKRIRDFAKELLPDKDLRTHNEAIMELGALICTPRKPQCSRCPIDHLCEGKKYNVQNELPIKTPRKPIPHYDVTAGIIWNDSKFLITLRPPKGLLGGLWEFPGGKREAGETLEACLKREIQEELNIRIRIFDHLVTVKHAYTHFRITLVVYQCIYLDGEIRMVDCEDYQWITINEIEKYAFPGADRKVINTLKEKLIRGRS